MPNSTKSSPVSNTPTEGDFETGTVHHVIVTAGKPDSVTIVMDVDGAEVHAYRHLRVGADCVLKVCDYPVPVRDLCAWMMKTVKPVRVRLKRAKAGGSGCEFAEFTT